MKDLRAHQRHIKDNTENFGNQMQLFKDLRSLLDVKRKTVAESERKVVKKHTDENEMNSVGDKEPISNALSKRFSD